MSHSNTASYGKRGHCRKLVQAIFEKNWDQVQELLEPCNKRQLNGQVSAKKDWWRPYTCENYDRIQITPLVAAVMAKAPDSILHNLIQGGADVNRPGRFESFPWASTCSPPLLAYQLRSPLYIAVKNTNVAATRILAQAGADVNQSVPGWKHAEEEGGMTDWGDPEDSPHRSLIYLVATALLHEANWKNGLEIAEIFLKHGAIYTLRNLLEMWTTLRQYRHSSAVIGPSLFSLRQDRHGPMVIDSKLYQMWRVFINGSILPLKDHGDLWKFFQASQLLEQLEQNEIQASCLCMHLLLVAGCPIPPGIQLPGILGEQFIHKCLLYYDNPRTLKEQARLATRKYMGDVKDRSWIDTLALPAQLCDYLWFSIL